jgi:ABC-2 type transport system permease protein
MKEIWALYKKEMRSYFTSPVAYAIIFIFLVITGFFFFSMMLSFSKMAADYASIPEYLQYFSVGEWVIRPLFGNLAVIMLFMLPILTMRLIAEEKRSGTLKLLLSYPISDIDVLVSKFLAAETIILIMFLLTFPVPMFLFLYGEPEWGLILTNYIGVILMAGAFIALGLFASSVTERQVVAAVISFGALIIIWVINWVKDIVGFTAGTVLDDLSLLAHIENFTKGVIVTHDVVYYVLLTFFFLFLALVALQARTWRSK